MQNFTFLPGWVLFLVPFLSFFCHFFLNEPILPGGKRASPNPRKATLSNEYHGQPGFRMTANLSSSLRKPLAEGLPVFASEVVLIKEHRRVKHISSLTTRPAIFSRANLIHQHGMIIVIGHR